LTARTPSPRRSLSLSRPSALGCVCHLWNLHPRHFCMGVGLAAGTVPDPNARHCCRIHLQCTAVDFRSRSTNRRHLNCRPRRLRQGGNDHRLVLYSWPYRRALLAGDEGNTSARGRLPLAVFASTSPTSVTPLGPRESSPASRGKTALSFEARAGDLGDITELPRRTTPVISPQRVAWKWVELRDSLLPRRQNGALTLKLTGEANG
jgi:hypothetical protein